MSHNSAHSKKSLPANSCIPLLIATLSLSYVPPTLAESALQHIQYVNNYDAFMAHTKQHIANVYSLGKFAYYKWSVDFGALPFELLHEYLLLHDRAKTADLETLRKYGYEGDRTLGERLYDFYGQDVSQLSEDQQLKMKGIINEVNALDELIRIEFLGSRGLIDDKGVENSLGKLLMKIEYMADITDRAVNPVSREEFAREMKPARDYFTDKADLVKAVLLEAHYPRIVNNKFIRISNRCSKSHL